VIIVGEKVYKHISVEDKMSLRPEDFQNYLFDSQRAVERMVDGKRAIEGVTFTDNFIKVGFTYYISSGELSMKNIHNQQLFFGKIASTEDFERAVKKADKKAHELRKKKA
jgi:hypothetical protein